MFRKWKKSLAVMIALALALVLDIAVAPTVVGVTNGNSAEVPVDVEFSGRPTSGYAPLHVQFTDETVLPTPFGMPLETIFARFANAGLPCEFDPDYARLWEFGDGATSTDANPSHVYRRAGKYTVKLTLFLECLHKTASSILPLDTMLPGRSPGQNEEEEFTASETKEFYITVWEREEILERPEPAKMVVAYLDISPQEVVQGQELEISVNVCNRGEEKGSHSVALMINGHAEQSQTVVVSPGSCQTVLFRTFKTVPGSYEVSVEGATGSFSVMPLFPGYVVKEAPPPESRGIGTAGIVTIVIVLIVLAVGLVLILRR
jgi:hypothetical protein